MKAIIFISIFIASLTVYSDELPTRLFETRYNDVLSCTKWKTEECNNKCIVSEERNCQEICQKKAKVECKQEFGIY